MSMKKKIRVALTLSIHLKELLFYLVLALVNIGYAALEWLRRALLYYATATNCTSTAEQLREPSKTFLR